MVCTDQRSLKYLLEQRLVTEEHQKWLSKLLGYDFDILYKPGKDNRVADALSRKNTVSDVSVLTVYGNLQWEALFAEMERNPETQQIKQKIRDGTSEVTGYTLEHDRLLYRNRLVLPRSSSWIPVLFREFHNTPVGGHSGGGRRTGVWQRRSIGLGCGVISQEWWQNVTLVRDRNTQLWRQVVYYNH